MCASDSVLVNVKIHNGKPPFIYEWTSANGQFITDFESVWLSDPGGYTVCVSSQNHSTSCLNFEVVESIIGCISAIEPNYNLEVEFPQGRPGNGAFQLQAQNFSFSESNSIQVFPVPASKEGTVIAMLARPIDGPVTYQILDLNGRILVQDYFELGSNSFTIPLRGLLGGTYILKIQAGETFIGKILIF